MYKRIHERENDGSGEIQRLDRSVVHYLGTGPKASISAVQSLCMGPEILISLQGRMQEFGKGGS